MSRPTAFVYHEVYDGRGFSRVRESWRRYALAKALLEEVGLLDGALRRYRQSPATLEELLPVHERGYVEFVRRRDAEGHGYLDYGDTPAYPGVWDRSLLAVGGTLLAARLIAAGEVRHAFNPGGGLHHARRERAAGFCVFNDVVVAVRALQREFGLSRIAILDFDGHHGDGTQDLLYAEPLLTVSLHRYGGRFFPGCGRADELGFGAGAGYNLNVPLPRQVGDQAYLWAVRDAVLPRLYAYRPELVVVQIGADGHHGDPLVRLGLTTNTYAELGALTHRAAHDLCSGRLLLVAGGGYRPEAVARCWLAFLSPLVGAPNAAAAGRIRELLRDDGPEPIAGAMAQVREVVAELRAVGALAEPVATVREGPSRVIDPALGASPAGEAGQ